MLSTSKIDIQYLHDAEIIKNAILSAQYEAARGANSLQLMLYYSVGRYISQNTRKGKWGTGAIASISRLLKQDLPGLRGFSASNLKRMRTFYEEWNDLDAEVQEPNSPVQTDDLENPLQNVDYERDANSPVQMGELSTAISFIQTNEIPLLPFNFPAVDAFPGNDLGLR